MNDPRTDPVPGTDGQVPPRALGFSVLALVVAGLAATMWPESLSDLTGLVWLLALAPAFLLAYYRGREGAASGLLVAMIVMIAIEVVPPLLTGTEVDWRIAGGVTVAFILASFGAGGMAELLRRQKSVALMLAYNDQLTDLPNRRMVDLFLTHHFAASQRRHPLSVAMFDLDKFKHYNDTYGHAAGDEALRVFADVLRRETRASDMSGRYGGEEFITILPNEDLEGACLYADRVRHELALHQLPTGNRITVSAGVATYGPTMKAAEDLVKAADTALYAAKAAGGNRVGPGAIPAAGLAPPIPEQDS